MRLPIPSVPETLMSERSLRALGGLRRMKALWPILNGLKKSQKEGLPWRCRVSTFCVPFSQRKVLPGRALAGIGRKSFVMSVKIRLKRVGARNHPVYRVVVADSRSPRDGKFIEEIGTYHPARTSDKVSIDLERVEHWIGQGAIPSDTIKSFLRAKKREAAAAAASAPAATEAAAE